MEQIKMFGKSGKVILEIENIEIEINSKELIMKFLKK